MKLTEPRRESKPPTIISTTVKSSTLGTVITTTLRVTFDEVLDTGSVPSTEDFHVTAGTNQRNVADDGVAISGRTVTLTLESASAVSLADTVRVGYTKPEINQLRDRAGNAVKTFANRSVRVRNPDHVSTCESVSRGVGRADNLADARADCEVLLEIKDTLRGTADLNWGDAEVAYTDWTGVTLFDTSRRVRYLILHDQGLSGEIPADLGELTSMQALYLTENEQLTGSIPGKLGYLSRLNWLRLHGNGLSGEIPSELGNLSGLKELNLWRNRLTGEIPSELGKLSDLTTLSLSENALSGSIPTELANLTNLHNLWLRDNNLTGEIPATLGQLNSLFSLSLSRNDLTGEIPAELGSIEQLRELYLAGNELTGEIPDELGNLNPLTHLDLSHNNLTGPIPDPFLKNEFGRRPEFIGFLQYLDLSHNQLSGPIPTENGNVFTTLWYIDLSHNQLTGTFHRKLLGTVIGESFGVWRLEHLDLSNNRLSGPLPDLTVGPAGTSGSFRLAQNLRVLYLHNNRLSGTLPDLRTNAPYLTDLGLGGGNDFGLNWGMFASDGILGLAAIHGNSSPASPLRGAQTPSFLTGYTDDGTPRYGQTSVRYPSTIAANSLRALYLHDSGLEGEIPDWVGDQSKLRALTLHDNSLTGSVPDLSNMPLHSVGLGGNDFDNLSWETLASGGDIDIQTYPRVFEEFDTPSAWKDSYVYSLQHLYLHDSGLTGPIPSWVGSENTDLRVLWLHNNPLTGRLPSNFRNLTKLEDLRLEGTRVTGNSDALRGTFGVSVADSTRGFSTRVFGRNIHFKLTLPEGADASRSRITLARGRDPQTDDIHIPPHNRIARIVSIIPGIAIDIILDIRDAQGEPISETQNVPALVCLGVPATYANQPLALLKFDGETWEVCRCRGSAFGLQRRSGQYGGLRYDRRSFAVGARGGRSCRRKRRRPGADLTHRTCNPRRDCVYRRRGEAELQHLGTPGHPRQRSRRRARIRVGRRERRWFVHILGPTQRDHLHRSDQSGNTFRHRRAANGYMSERPRRRDAMHGQVHHHGPTPLGGPGRATSTEESCRGDSIGAGRRRGASVRSLHARARRQIRRRRSDDLRGARSGSQPRDHRHPRRRCGPSFERRHDASALHAGRRPLRRSRGRCRRVADRFVRLELPAGGVRTAASGRAQQHLGRGDRLRQPRRHADRPVCQGADHRIVRSERVRQPWLSAGHNRGRHRRISGCDSDAHAGSGRDRRPGHGRQRSVRLRVVARDLDELRGDLCGLAADHARPPQIGMSAPGIPRSHRFARSRPFRSAKGAD